MKTTDFLVCTLSASLVVADSSLRLYHRVWEPSTPPPAFTLRANIQLSLELGPVLVVPPQFPEATLWNPDLREDTFYQVALEREDDLSESDWDLSSVKACHHAQAQSEIINLHLSSPGKPYAIDYFVHPVPHDGSCPKKALLGRAGSITNTTLTFQLASAPPLPELRVPPPLSPQGEPIKPVAEKSFIEKYWMYIGLGLLTLVLTGGSAPEEDGGGQVQGGAGGRAGGR